MDQNYHEADITGGFSNESLLIVSISGFLVIGTILAIIVWRSPKDNGDSDNNGGEGTQKDYDQQLEDADVSTLNRAQRRARAKNRMKRNRRIEVPPQRQVGEGEGGDGDDEGDAQQPLLLVNQEENDGDEVAIQNSNNHLSRKERQKAAKEKERDERRKYEEERKKLVRRSEEEARAFKKQREKEMLERKRMEEMERKEREMKEYERWRMMFPLDFEVSDDDDMDTSARMQTDSEPKLEPDQEPEPQSEPDMTDIATRTTPSYPLQMTVQEFISHLEKHRIISLRDMALHFGVGTNDLRERLRQLEDERRIHCGIIDDAGNYIYFSPKDLQSVARFVHNGGDNDDITRDCIPMTAVANECNRIVAASRSEMK